MKTRQNKTKQNKTKNRNKNKKYTGGYDPNCPSCPTCLTSENVQRVSSSDLSVVFCVCTKCHWTNYK